MHLALLSFILLGPVLLGSVRFTAGHGQDGQVFLQDGGVWNVTGYTLAGCGGANKTSTGDDDQGCSPLNNGLSSLAFRYDGIETFKLCLWGDADCKFFRGSSYGDKDQTCHNIALHLTADSFTIVNVSQPCVTA